VEEYFHSLSPPNLSVREERGREAEATPTTAGFADERKT
jgi:hypothetical protein